MLQGAVMVEGIISALRLHTSTTIEPVSEKHLPIQVKQASDGYKSS